MTDTFRAIDTYYRRIESRLGYTFVLGDAKHFGYYPNGIADISEREALELQQKLIGDTLLLKPTDKVLDAGCGRGVTACYLAEKYGAYVMGVDLLEFELKSARHRAAQRNLQQKTSFVAGDFRNLESVGKEFDAIYTSETLSHAPVPREVIEQFFKFLKPGGRIVLMEYTIAPEDQFTEKETQSLDFVITGSAMFGLKQFRHDQFSNVLRDVGFTNVKETILTAHILPSFNRLYEKSKWAYKIAKMLGISKYLINTSTPTLLKSLLDKGLIRYCMFSAVKP